MSKQRIKVETYEDFAKYIQQLPASVIQDVDKRISDWLAGGGSPDDPYIKQQYRYVENLVNYYYNNFGGK